MKILKLLKKWNVHNQKEDDNEREEVIIVREWNKNNRKGTLVEVTLPNRGIKAPDKTLGLARLVHNRPYIDLECHGGAYLKDIRFLPKDHPKEEERKKELTIKILKTTIFLFFFFLLLLFASWCASIIFKNNDLAPLIAALTLAISFALRAFIPESNKYTVRVGKLLADLFATCLTFLSLVTLPYFYCSENILYFLIVILCLLAIIAIYKDI